MSSNPSAMTSTARTVGGQLVTEQGGGRVDVAAAVRTPVVATATLALGTYGADDTGTVTRTVRYTNTSAEDVTLELRAALATSGGRQITDGAVTPDRTDVTVPAGGTPRHARHDAPQDCEIPGLPVPCPGPCQPTSSRATTFASSVVAPSRWSSLTDSAATRTCGAW